jgi:perosamine synthetase
MASSRWLPYGRQWIDESDIAAVAEALASDFLTTGPRTTQFEGALSAYTGAPFSAAVNSGTSALHCAYAACGLSKDDEFITTPLTFAATANVGLELGAKVRFVDIDPLTGNIDPQLIPEALTERTKLIVPVDFTGRPAEYDLITPVARQVGARVVSDAAHSLGATYKGRKVGTLADATTLSLHPVKAMTTGEGGAILSADPVIDDQARRFRSHGMVKTLEITDREGAWYYEIQSLGLNYRITDIQCALGISQLLKLDRFIERRRAIVARYQEALSTLNAVIIPRDSDNASSGWHLFVLRLKEPKAELRRRLFDRMVDLGLRVQVHYIPVYWHPLYQDLGFQKGLCPHAEDYYRSCISLPLFPKMTDDDVDWSIEQILRAVNEIVE